MTITELNTHLAEKIRTETGENVFLCYQCVKCTSGCPLAEYFDLAPNQVMRAAQLGQDEIALNAKTPWLCAGCQTCTTRCPQGIDVAKVMDFMAREAAARRIPAKVPEVALFNKVFLRNVNLLGRAYELGLIAEMKLRTGRITDDLDLGVKLLRKRKLAFLPTPSRPPRSVKPVPGASKAVAYYPGCSLHSTAKEFDVSARAVGEAPWRQGLRGADRLRHVRRRVPHLGAVRGRRRRHPRERQYHQSHRRTRPRRDPLARPRRPARRRVHRPLHQRR